MSHNKCFYCENEGTSVDHYTEVAERGDLVFTWENLYLSCDDCQNKIPNTSIPVTDCVDPCRIEDPPEDHLMFESEYVRYRTPKGEQTVKKYKLNRELLVSQRRKMLQTISETILSMCKSKGTDDFNASERAKLRQFAQSDHLFSMLCTAYLDKHSLR
jgi:hypothetical protein